MIIEFFIQQIEANVRIKWNPENGNGKNEKQKKERRKCGRKKKQLSAEKELNKMAYDIIRECHVMSQVSVNK